MNDCLVCMVECIPSCIPDSHPHRITSTKCHINTVVPPDDGHIVARNMYRNEINRVRKCAPSWFYLQDYRGMHGQQNIKSHSLYLKIITWNCQKYWTPFTDYELLSLSLFFFGISLKVAKIIKHFLSSI